MPKYLSVVVYEKQIKSWVMVFYCNDALANRTYVTSTSLKQSTSLRNTMLLSVFPEQSIQQAQP
jgi:hypothetical protein